MADELPPLLNDDATRSLADDMRQLVEDGRTLVEAEIAYQSSRAKMLGGRFGGIIGMGALALALVFFALMALTVGLVIALTPQLTALGAAGAVFGGLLACALLAWVVASMRWRRVKRALSERAGPERDASQ